VEDSGTDQESGSMFIPALSSTGFERKVERVTVQLNLLLERYLAILIETFLALSGKRPDKHTSKKGCKHEKVSKRTDSIHGCLSRRLVETLTKIPSFGSRAAKSGFHVALDSRLHGNYASKEVLP